MRALNRILFVALVASLPAAAASDIRDSLDPLAIRVVRINLNSGGGGLGFEAELAGSDPRVEPLVALIRGAEPGGGHKCANAGAIRFRMTDGRLIGVGLLPGHARGEYALRLYDGDELTGVYRVERATLLDVMENLGVPMDDPAFRE